MLSINKDKNDASNDKDLRKLDAYLDELIQKKSRKKVEEKIWLVFIFKTIKMIESTVLTDKKTSIFLDSQKSKNISLESQNVSQSINQENFCDNNEFNLNTKKITTKEILTDESINLVTNLDKITYSKDENFSVPSSQKNSVNTFEGNFKVYDENKDLEKKQIIQVLQKKISEFLDIQPLLQLWERFFNIRIPSDSLRKEISSFKTIVLKTESFSENLSEKINIFEAQILKKIFTDDYFFADNKKDTLNCSFKGFVIDTDLETSFQFFSSTMMNLNEYIINLLKIKNKKLAYELLKQLEMCKLIPTFDELSDFVYKEFYHLEKEGELIHNAIRKSSLYDYFDNFLYYDKGKKQLSSYINWKEDISTIETLFQQLLSDLRNKEPEFLKEFIEIISTFHSNFHNYFAVKNISDNFKSSFTNFEEYLENSPFPIAKRTLYKICFESPVTPLTEDDIVVSEKSTAFDRELEIMYKKLKEKRATRNNEYIETWELDQHVDSLNKKTDMKLKFTLETFIENLKNQLKNAIISLQNSEKPDILTVFSIEFIIKTFIKDFYLINNLKKKFDELFKKLPILSEIRFFGALNTILCNPINSKLYSFDYSRFKITPKYTLNLLTNQMYELKIGIFNECQGIKKDHFLPFQPTMARQTSLNLKMTISQYIDNKNDFNTIIKNFAFNKQSIDSKYVRNHIYLHLNWTNTKEKNLFYKFIIESCPDLEEFFKNTVHDKFLNIYIGIKNIILTNSQSKSQLKIKFDLLNQEQKYKPGFIINECQNLIAEVEEEVLKSYFEFLNSL